MEKVKKLYVALVVLFLYAPIGVLVAQSFNASLLCEPWSITNKAGEPFKVITPFWRACQDRGLPSEIHRAPRHIFAARRIAGDALASWALCPTRPNWAREFGEHWTPGEPGAKARLSAFLDDALRAYADGRDRPSTKVVDRP